MSKVPRVRSLHIFVIFPEKHRGWSWFLPADKDESFLQVDSITLDVLSQACPKYPKQQVYNIFAISQELSWFLPADEPQRFLQISTIILGVCGQACPNYPK